MAKVFEGIDWAAGKDRGFHMVTIGPDATPEDVQAFRDAYDLGCAWAAVEMVIPEGWRLAVQRTDEDFATWAATAVSPAFFEGENDDDYVDGQGPTTVAALRALADKLGEAMG